MPEPFFLFDTVTISNFALADCLDLLAERYGHQLLLTVEVLDEIANGVTLGYAPLQKVEQSVEANIFTQTTLTWEERQTFRDILRQLDSGESSCLAVAHHRKGIVATDDQAARAYCENLVIPFTGTVGILKACCLEKYITPEKADCILNRMGNNGFYSPIKKLTDLL